jgi:putative transposase
MSQPNPFRHFKTSPEVVRLAVLMYVRFPLSLLIVKDLLHQRGIEVGHQAACFRWNRSGPMFVAEIKSKRIHRMHAFSTSVDA